ncbi:DDE_Tnp_1-associated family protein, partial [Mycobacterium ulcerans str. Harvey]
MMIFGAALLGRSVGTGYLENDRVGYCSSLVWSCPCLPFQYCLCRRFQSVRPLECWWSAELIGSEFLDVLASVPDPRDPRGRRYSLMALLAIAVLATAAGMRGYA